MGVTVLPGWSTSYRKATIYHVLDLNHGQLWRDLAHNARSRHRSVLVDFILGD